MMGGDEVADGRELGDEEGVAKELAPAFPLHVAREDELVRAALHESDEAEVVLVAEVAVDRQDGVAVVIGRDDRVAEVLKGRHRAAEEDVLHAPDQALDAFAHPVLRLEVANDTGRNGRVPEQRTDGDIVGEMRVPRGVVLIEVRDVEAVPR